MCNSSFAKALDVRNAAIERLEEFTERYGNSPLPLHARLVSFIARFLLLSSIVDDNAG